MNKILIFAGTTEGRRIAKALADNGQRIVVSTATEYGKEVAAEHMEASEHVTVLAGRMDCAQMRKVMRQYDINAVIDATHPFARIVTGQIKEACELEGIMYRRVLREQTLCADEGAAVCVKSVEEAVDYLSRTTGNILITTGSKELHLYTALADYKERCYARVLSTRAALETSISLGFEGSHLIGMQGPFSAEMNEAMIRQTNAAYLVTKESGSTGGFPEKALAARKTGAVLVVIGRPEEDGITVEECLRRFGIAEEETVKRRVITLAGIGTGAVGQMTTETVRAFKSADCVIGAERMLAYAKSIQKPVRALYKAEEIKAYIEEHPEYRSIVIALSGDISFYSGAKKLRTALMTLGEVRMLSGISSVAYLAGKLGVPLEEAYLASLHGRACNVVGKLKKHGKVFLLVSSGGEINELCKTLCGYGYGDVSVTAGSRLSYEDESICEMTAREGSSYAYANLSVLYLENKQWREPVTVHGRPDEDFVRGNVPMTKSEVRSISISKLALRRDSVIYDVGAGTGSVAIEMAAQAEDGMVYAVERKKEGAALIRENQKKMQTDNLQVIEGTAPEALEELPPPTHVFVGGSAGNLREILDTVRAKNASVRIVVNAITLNTVSECMEYIKAHTEITAEIVQAQIARGKKIAGYEMMMGENPVYIITIKKDEEQ